MRGRAVLLALAFCAGCAERDNPYDPVNLPPRKAKEIQPITWIPTPRKDDLVQGDVVVVLPDSIAPGQRKSIYAGSLAAALSGRKAGDTIYVYGGESGREYPISGQLTILNQGTLDKPLVILSFGGRVQFRLDPPSSQSYPQYCLRIENSHVRMVGFDFEGGEASVILVGGGPLSGGSIDFDSINLSRPGDSFGIEVRNLRGPVKIHNMTIRNYPQNIATPINLHENAQLDTSNIFW